MSTDAKTVAFIVEQAAMVGAVSAKPMFGEYGLYHDGKMVAMVCDNQLFVKPTSLGRAFAPEAKEAPPYPGAKACLLIDPERWDGGEWMSELFRISSTQLPLPKRKAKREAKRG